MTEPTRVPLNGKLSETQRKVLELGHEGLTDKAIAERLKLTMTTVRYHWRQLDLIVPGDWPMRGRAILWWRGAPEHLLYREPRPMRETPPIAPTTSDLLERLRRNVRASQSDGAAGTGGR